MEIAKIKSFLSRYALYLWFLMLIIVLSMISPTFGTLANIVNVIRQVSIVGILAVGMTFTIITGGIDLSAGSIVAMGAVFACFFSTTTNPLPLPVAILIGMAVSVLCGFINGFIIAKFKVAPFIVTMAMMTMARGVALVFTNGRPIINLTKDYTDMGGGYLLGIPIPIYLFLIVVIIGIYLLEFTKFGRHVKAIGGNEKAAIVSGVNVKSVKIIAYSLSGLLAGIAGIVLSSRVMTGQPILGQGYELDAIAAAVIGGTSLTGGIGSIWGTITGIFLLGVLSNGLDLLNVTSYWQQIVKGIIILIAVIVDRKRQH